MRAAVVGSAVVLATWLLTGQPRPAAACSPFVNEPYETDGRDGADLLPPGPVTADGEFERIVRHEDDMCMLGGGTLEVVASASDDRSAVVGFVVRDLATSLPMTGPRVPGVLGSLIYYLEDDTAPAMVELAAVDRAGNQGPWTQVAVRDASPVDDHDGGGCSAGSRVPAGAALALVALLPGMAGGARRRRGRGAPAGGLLGA